MIPDAAVEAAARAYMQYPRTRGLDNTENMLRAALEAAAPHMGAAQAWQVGFSAGRDFEDFYFKSAEAPSPLPQQPPNPYL